MYGAEKDQGAGTGRKREIGKREEGHVQEQHRDGDKIGPVASACPPVRQRDDRQDDGAGCDTDRRETCGIDGACTERHSAKERICCECDHGDGGEKVLDGHFPDADATARASGADDILDAAQVYPSLVDALADCVAVVGTSARLRTLSCPVLRPRESAANVAQAAGSGPVAIVFGRERTGLTNDELDHCHWLVNIPANEAFSSLNLAMAVQLIGYEIRLATHATEAAETPRDLPSAAEMERLYDHFNEVMLETGFLDPEHPRYLARRVRLLVNRATPDQNEVNILRGFLASIQKSLVNND